MVYLSILCNVNARRHVNPCSTQIIIIHELSQVNEISISFIIDHAVYLKQNDNIIYTAAIILNKQVAKAGLIDYKFLH